MILLPIGRDDAEIQRHAWVSYIIIGLNVLAFLITFGIESSVEDNVDSSWRTAVQYYAAHPYLEMPQEMQDILPDDMEAELRQQPAPGAVEERAPRREQAELDALTETAVEATQKLPTIRFGYVPKHGSLLTMITSMFLHGGLLHLVGNMLFFYLSGPFIEDLFGRPLFGLLYTTGGIVSTLAYQVRHPHDATPLIGASGAIAAVMGAYLVRLAKSKIRFLFIPFLFRPHRFFTFDAPAFIVLPLWFGQQFLEMQGEHLSSTAFSAHVGGFIWGAAFAGVVALTGFEDKYVKPVIEKQTSWKADPRLVDAMNARAAGNHDGAKQTLAAILRDDPTNVDAMRLAIDVAEEAEDDAMLDNVGSRLFARFVEMKDNDSAAELLHELNARPLPKLLVRGAQFAERNADREWAIELYERAIAADGANSAASLQALMKVSTLLRLKGDRNGARSALTRAKAHPACTAEWAPTIDAKLQQL